LTFYGCQTYYGGMTVAVYAGTFDPVTFGHLDIIRRAAGVFDRIVVTATEGISKTPVFTLEERIDLLAVNLRNDPNVVVLPFTGLLVDFVRSIGAKVIVRGLRAASDFEYEFEMAMMNRSLAPDIETAFFVTSPQYMFVSSTLIREIAFGGGDITPFVPPSVRDAIITKLARPGNSA
jgi:pantetheine-phosphate adenylyltransferase